MEACTELYLRCLAAALPRIVEVATKEHPQLTVAAIEELKVLLNQERLIEIFRETEDDIDVAAEQLAEFAREHNLDLEIEQDIPNECQITL